MNRPLNNIEARTDNEKSLRCLLQEQMATQRLSLRRVEALTGVSASTLSRFLRGHYLIHHNHARLSAWLTGKPIPREAPIAIHRFSLAGRTFIVTIEEATE